MFDIYLAIDSIVVFALFILGLTVVLKDSALELNRFFSGFVLCVAIWIITNYVSSDLTKAPHTAVIANYFVFAFSFLSSVFLLLFAISLSNDRKARRLFGYFMIPLALVAAGCFTPWLVKGVIRQDKVYAVVFGPLIPVYGVALLGTLITTFVIIKRNIKGSSSLQSGRLRVLLRSLSFSMPLLVVTEFVLPTVTGWFGLTNLGILSMLILVVGLYYGVIKHRLFDLKLVVARSLAYALSLLTIGGLFVLTSYLVTGIGFHNKDLSLVTLRWIYSLLAVTFAIGFASVKRFFDRATNRIFFRDAYDTQAFLDQLNKILVSTFELSPLLRKSAAIIEENLKPQFCMFGIRETKYTERRLFGTSNLPKFSEEDIAFVRETTVKLNRKLIVTDLLEPRYESLKKVLQDNNIALIARLTSHANQEGIGYIVFGVKKSGNVYSSQDLTVIEIVANELVIATQNSLRFEEIANFNITLQAKVDDATRKLRRTNEKLKALDETKDDFISMASHQLRTPLTSVKGYISMVLEEDAGKVNAVQREMLGQAFFSSQRMVYLIADLLNVSRLKTGKFIIDAAPVNLAQIVEQEMQQLQESAAARGHTLTYEKPDKFPELMLDETKTRQVIMNFTDNAIYYTPNGGHIKVRLIDTPTTVELRVEDDGIGVPKHEQMHLFTKFYRAGNARQARPDGTGLGLFMAKKVIVAQGGSLLFESTEGKGSTFGFVFSKSKLAVHDGSKSKDEATTPVARPK